MSNHTTVLNYGGPPKIDFHARAFKVTGTYYTDRSASYDLLLVIHSNHGSILCQDLLSLPSLRVDKWVPAIAGKAKAGMDHSDCGWTCGCAGKTVKSLENTCHTWALLRWWFTTKRRCILTW